MPDSLPSRNVRAVAAVLLVQIATSPGQTYLVSAFNAPLREALGLDADECLVRAPSKFSWGELL